MKRQTNQDLQSGSTSSSVVRGSHNTREKITKTVKRSQKKAAHALRYDAIASMSPEVQVTGQTEDYNEVE